MMKRLAISMCVVSAGCVSQSSVGPETVTQRLRTACVRSTGVHTADLDPDVAIMASLVTFNAARDSGVSRSDTLDAVLKECAELSGSQEERDACAACSRALVNHVYDH